MKILIIEDEPDLLNEMLAFLDGDGFVCESANNYMSADEKLTLYHYDIALVDITLPGGNGLSLIEKLKSKNNDTGIIIISAKNSLVDKLNGLNIGADDYISKPFHLTELNARIKAVLRRRKFEGALNIVFNEIEICPEKNSVLINNKPIVLTKKELELLILFIANKNKVLTKESIAEHLWGDNIDLSDNFDFIYTHIRNLRKKILSNHGNDYLRNIYGIGYKYTDQ